MGILLVCMSLYCVCLVIEEGVGFPGLELQVVVIVWMLSALQKQQVLLVMGASSPAPPLHVYISTLC